MIEFIFLCFFAVLFAEAKRDSNNNVPAIFALRALLFAGFIVSLLLCIFALNDWLDSFNPTFENNFYGN